MDKETAIKLFEDKRVRVLWDEDLEKWFFSIIDVVGVLSESDNPRKYWSVLKTRLKAEGSQGAVWNLRISHSFFFVFIVIYAKLSHKESEIKK